MKEIAAKKILNWSAVLIWMAVIFGLSAMPGSGEHYFSWIYFLERKIFHVLEYFILAVLLYRALSQDIIFKKAVWFSIVIAFIYAASDEWHQTFVFGRGGAARDVAIDFLGIMLAAIFILKFKQRKDKKKWQKKKK